MTSTTLDLSAWATTGVLRIDSFLSGNELANLRRWVDEIERHPSRHGEMRHYDEEAATGRRVRCRTENIVPYHTGMRSLLASGDVVDIAGALLGERARLYKEKINFKHPGGAGFAPHQDAHAYPFVQETVTCMIAVDDALVANGCLEVVEGLHSRALPTDEHGCIPPDMAAMLDWVPLPTRAGSLLWFHCYTPHRSGPNSSQEPRRAIYATYNRASDGDQRAAYYEQKNRLLDNGANEGRISLIGHFLGQTTPAERD
jgi:2-aminoethylphosphonate dioxygenase